MAEDKETSTRAEQIRKERAARLEKLIRTLEAGQDKDADQFKKVDKLDRQRVKLAKKEEKFEDLGKKLFQSTMGGMFGGMGKSIPEPVKIMGRMVGVMFGARGRIKKKKAKLLKKVYKRAAEVGMDTSSFAEKSPEALEEIEKNLDIIEDIKLPEEPKSKKRYDPIGFLLGKGPSGEVPGAAPDESAELGKGAFASGVGGLSEAANKAIIDLSAEGLKVGSIFVHDEKMLEFYKDRMDTPAQKAEKEKEAASLQGRKDERWDRLFKILEGASGKGGGGSGESKGGFMAGFIKSVLNPKSAASMLAGAAIIGNPISVKLFLLAVTAIGGFFGALLTTLGIGILVLGATLIVLGKGLKAVAEGMADIPGALKEFETIDGPKLQQAIKGMNGLFLALAGFGLGGWVSELADTTKLKEIPGTLKEFETIDGEKLSVVGKGMKALGVGLGAQGLGGAIGSIGNLIAGGVDKLGKLLGIDGPVAMLEEFSLADIDEVKVEKNAKAMVAWAKAMAASGLGVTVSTIGTLATAVTDGLLALFGVKDADPISQLKKFGAEDLDPLGLVKSNAEAMAAFGKAMENAPVVKGSVVGGLFGAIVEAFGGTVVYPWEQVETFAAAKLDAEKIRLNAEALVAFSTAMESLPKPVDTTRVGGVFGAIKTFFAGDIKMPWKDVTAFGLLQFNTKQIMINAEALREFAVAMENMPAEVEGFREGGVIGAIATFFAGNVTMPWEQVKDFADANLGDLDSIKANTEKLVAFSKAMEYMPPPMDTGPTLSLPDFGAILANIKARFTGGVAAILSNIPTWALPAAAEEWLAANQAPEQALQAAEARKEAAQQRLAKAESSKVEIQGTADTVQSQQQTAITEFLETGKIGAAMTGEQSDTAQAITDDRKSLEFWERKKNTAKVAELKEQIKANVAKLNTDKINADAVAEIARLDAVAATERQKIVTADETIAQILKDVKLGEHSSLKVTLVDQSGTPIDATKWSLTPHGFLAKEYVENLAVAASQMGSLGGTTSQLGPDFTTGGEVPAEAADTGMQGAGGTQQLRGGATVQNMSAEAWKTTTTSRGASSHKNYGVEGKKSWGYRAGKLGASKAFVVHHTAGRGTAQGVMNVFKKRNVSSNFIIDRDGVIWRSVPPGYRSQHMRKGQGKGKGLSNSNTQSVEIIAKDDADVTSKQVGAAMSLISSLGYKANQVLGHGEVNPHKRKTEGNKVVSAIRGEPRLLHRDERKQLGSGELEAVQLGSVTGFAAQREELFGGSSVSVEAPDSPDTTPPNAGRGEMFVPDPNLHLLGGNSAYKKLTTNKERTDWLNKKIELASSPAFMALGERDQTLKWIGQMEAELGRIAVRPRTNVGKNVHGQNLTPAPGSGGGGTVIVNNSGNSNLATKNVNTQLNQDPGWAVFHTPVYRRGGYAL